MAVQQLPTITTTEALHEAAAAGLRVRMTGVVADCGYGHSGRYRNRWLHIRTNAGTIRVTAAQNSPLGLSPSGTWVELAVRLTGMVDLTRSVFYAQRPYVTGLVRP